MSKPSTRKQKKQKARQRAKTKNAVIAKELRNYRQNFPSFILRNETEADPGFVKLVRRAVSQIDFRDSQLFTPAETEIFKSMGRNGVAFTKTFLNSLEPYPEINLRFCLKVGRVLFAKIPTEEIAKYIPYNDVSALFDGRDIVLHFRGLHKKRSPNGTIYFSKHRPTIRIDGQEVIVGFSRHAIERICERIVPRWRTYAGLADAFAFFEQCLKFEAVNLYRGHLAFTFFGQYPKGEAIVDQIMDQNCEDLKNLYLRIGYCPAVIEDGFVRAKTLLLPGFDGTPERTAIHSAGLQSPERKRLLDAAGRLDINEIKLASDRWLLKWFHEHGVPQVIRSEERLYAKAI